MSDLAPPDAPAALDFRVKWARSSWQTMTYKGITRSNMEGSFLTLGQGDKSWIINMEHVVHVTIKPTTEGAEE